MDVTEFDDLSHRLRESLIDKDKKKVLITRIQDTIQSRDTKLKPNCSGYGRIRHFKRINPKNHPIWPKDPLPIDPAIEKLDLPSSDNLKAQVFQIAGCNYNCWYCFVDEVANNANAKFSSFFSTDELFALYLKEINRPHVIDLSGGQPDLVPEWILWFIRTLKSQDIKNVYLWSDDNLSIDFFGTKLNKNEQTEIIQFRNYDRVCCFKGFDPKSFSFNTRKSSALYERQFEIMDKYYSMGLMPYAYATFTYIDMDEHGVKKSMERFIYKLREINEFLPLKTVPLQIHDYSPVRARKSIQHKFRAYENQIIAINYWNSHLASLYSKKFRDIKITDV